MERILYKKDGSDHAAHIELNFISFIKVVGGAIHFTVLGSDTWYRVTDPYSIELIKDFHDIEV